MIRLFAVAIMQSENDPDRWFAWQVEAMYRTINTVANGKAKVCCCDTLTEGHDIASEVTAAY